ncbi:MAG TPA: hypothetical protein PKM78_03710, partial [Anaerolineae bacterium]|nr:hypothetical protein [Anaerolineae bacterium]HNU02995.1 hypothetical protein [Anaerolineae bacterium]
MTRSTTLCVAASGSSLSKSGTPDTEISVAKRTNTASQDQCAGRGNKEESFRMAKQVFQRTKPHVNVGT